MPFYVYFIMAIEEEIAMPPLSGVILPGVTRKSMIELARTWVRCERERRREGRTG